MSQNSKLQLLKLMTQKTDQLCTKEHWYSAEEDMDSIVKMLQRSQNFLLTKQAVICLIAVSAYAQGKMINVVETEENLY